ncbi:L,D-transpeptidase family protein [Agrobacterium larrymoorei]|uniref:Murein L,D-transpeptidase n=1 Tax=Agrobacterium larrymoorei TaxID=160699 RepID=A0A4D7DYD8_9HYPH|nr:murein L,D-transpeptidase family protein [Agrobacterium larrymoorei]QCI99829.1 murein L,D-transpeptidase [Agrobacterium larrymoorei]QYA09734.1 murein L,D-transpeptidase [Agrobacterium larrymoorei]
MRLRQIALLACTGLMLAGCNETLETVERDVSHVKNKVDYPLSPSILAEMDKKNMDRNAPIMIRILKEEGKLEVWKAKRDNRFEVIASYDICAWSGKLGPKVKEGDRQAPEGFYNLSPGHMNPYSNYYLSINTGFPNRYDQANGRNGTNLMIHGACSSSGCYSMTDAQMLEIYGFARDAFKGGQKAIQLQALPFRMTAENMARHHKSENYEFWKMLKVGYDNFEITKRPPEVNFCEKKYVFNQQTESGQFSAAAACPSMSTPPALVGALSSYNKTYDVAYEKAMKKFDGMVWYDPSEAERKVLVADKRKGREPAYAPTGSALKAGKLMKETEFAALMEKKAAKGLSAPAATAIASASSSAPTSISATSARSAAAPQPAPVAHPASIMVASAAPTAAAGQAPQANAGAQGIPVPAVNPLAFTAPATDEQAAKKPFWKFWAKE